MSSAWIGLIGALGGVALTGIVGVGSAALTHRWNAEARREDREHERAVADADRRRDAYLRYATSASLFLDAWGRALDDEALMAECATVDPLRRIAILRDRITDASQGYDTARDYAELLARDSVREAIEAFNTWLTEEMTALILAPSGTAPRFVGLSERNTELMTAMRTDLLAWNTTT
jgi:hypothetical protein